MRSIGLLIAGMFLLGVHGPAWGDATIESTIKSSGFKGMGAFEGAATKRYQGEKMWDSSSSKFTGAILSRIAGGSESATVTRVDKESTGSWTRRTKLMPKDRSKPSRRTKREKSGKSRKSPKSG